MLIIIDPGHGGEDPGALGSHSKEKDINLSISLLLRDKLRRSGINIVMTRESDVFVDLDDRCTIANKNKADYFISIHCNSAENNDATGLETYCISSGGKAYELAKVIQKEMIAYLSVRDRGVKFANFYVLRETDMPAVLIENLFISNPNEEVLLNDAKWQEGMADRLAQTIAVYTGAMYIPEEKTPIMGNAEAESSQMDTFVKNVNPDAPYLAALYLSIGAREGVRGDMAFAQAIYETGYFRFGGNVSSSQNNYAGLGSTGAGVSGASFSTPEEGVTAHIQHLKAYASTEALNTPLVDPRFYLVQRGSAVNWEDLNGKWAVPGIGYGENIVAIWEKILLTEVPENHFAKEEYEKWKAEGIILEDHDLESPVKWGEYIITQKRLREK